MRISQNFSNSPKLFEHRNSFDARMDFNLNEKNQLFYRFSLVDDPQFIPGIFGGVADGGGFQQGTQTAIAEQSALGYTHTFSPTLVNVLRGGLNYLHTTRVSPSANNLTDIPSQFGIKGIPQLSENGGLPAFGINGLQTLGSNAFLPSDEVSSTLQVTDDLTKIYGTPLNWVLSGSTSSSQPSSHPGPAENLTTTATTPLFPATQTPALAVRSSCCFQGPTPSRAAPVAPISWAGLHKYTFPIFR